MINMLLFLALSELSQQTYGDLHEILGDECVEPDFSQNITKLKATM